MHAMDKTSPCGVVILTAFNADQEKLFEQTLSVVEYYEQLHPLIDDDNELRVRSNIRNVVGRIYDYDGTLDQHFTNAYDANGQYVNSRIVFNDGSVAEG